jgi:hypothetical protein
MSKKPSSPCWRGAGPEPQGRARISRTRLEETCTKLPVVRSPVVHFGVNLRQLRIIADVAGNGDAGIAAAGQEIIPIPAAPNRGDRLPRGHFEVAGHGYGRRGHHARADIGRPSAILRVVDFEGLGEDAKIINHPGILRGPLHALEGRDGQCGQQADDDDDNHDLNERESARGAMAGSGVGSCSCSWRGASPWPRKTQPRTSALAANT